MKILHIISQIPNFTVSGKYLQALMRCASIKGHENFLEADIQGDFELERSIIHLENCRYLRFEGQDLGFPVLGMSDIMVYSSIFSPVEVFNQANGLGVANQTKVSSHSFSSAPVPVSEIIPGKPFSALPHQFYL